MLIILSTIERKFTFSFALRYSIHLPWNTQMSYQPFCHILIINNIFLIRSSVSNLQVQQIPSFCPQVPTPAVTNPETLWWHSTFPVSHPASCSTQIKLVSAHYDILVISVIHLLTYNPLSQPEIYKILLNPVCLTLFTQAMI